MAEACMNLSGIISTNCSALEFFFSSEQNYSGKNYVLRERANLPNRAATDSKSFMPLIWKDI